ncbi:cytochrome P450 family protein [Tieghemostelium lacteum]|uniref:Cytochrome P450 family protein n=1 Tax=Tieghemostelium lacteum TaxID=361077 RepID=A0A151ZEI6_TIELA|nr:cytochrome P450 family protein [Tieghemostelium lacteum]|eukprot:KYQ92304.1 cytochrome P450 family protein [Tieghemostelium lacteum]
MENFYQCSNNPMHSPIVGKINSLQIEYFFILIIISLGLLLSRAKREHFHIPICTTKHSFFKFWNRILRLELHLYYRDLMPDNPFPIFRTLFFGHEMIILQDPNDIKYVMNNRPEKYIRGKDVSDAINVNGSNVVGLEGHHWKTQRKFTASPFNTLKINRMDRDINDYSNRIMTRLSRSIDNPQCGIEVNISNETVCYTLDAIFKIAFGFELNLIEKSRFNEISRIAEYTSYGFPIVQKRVFSPFPYWRLFKTPTEKRFELLRELAYQVKDEIKYQWNSPHFEKTELLSGLFQEREQGIIDDESFVCNLMVYMITGHETSAKTLANFIWMVSENPEIQEKLQQEIDRELSILQSQLGHNLENLSFHHLDNFKYLQQVLLETLRLKPIVPVVFLEANQDDIINGHTEIYEGARIVIPYEMIYRSEKYFPNADQFDPERWSGVLFDHCNEHHLFPFGYGPKICPGRKLVKMEVLIYLIKFFKCFNVSPPTTPSHKNISEHLDFVLSTDKPIYVTIKNR